jgi:hypothetical protein
MIYPPDLIKALLLLMFAAIVGMNVPNAEASTCRSTAVKHQFDIQQGYPHGRKGFIVDHICALAQGGIDSPTNMQYQTTIDSKVKDRVENTPEGKRIFCTSNNSTPTRQVFNCK